LGETPTAGGEAIVMLPRRLTCTVGIDFARAPASTRGDSGSGAIRAIGLIGAGA
jgi:hypothetical protein